VIIAETGAKNGREWPTSSVATTHASVAAIVAWRIARAASRRRSARARAEIRERSAASSISGCARSVEGPVRLGHGARCYGAARARRAGKIYQRTVCPNEQISGQRSNRACDPTAV
jgi:hypothetical protein